MDDDDDVGFDDGDVLEVPVFHGDDSFTSSETVASSETVPVPPPVPPPALVAVSSPSASFAVASRTTRWRVFGAESLGTARQLAEELIAGFSEAPTASVKNAELHPTLGMVVDVEEWFE